MKVLKRNEKELVLSKPLVLSKETEEAEALFWSDIYVYPDIVAGEKNVVYLYDSRNKRLYWGYLGNKKFSREDEEKEILKELGLLD